MRWWLVALCGTFLIWSGNGLADPAPKPMPSVAATQIFFITSPARQYGEDVTCVGAVNTNAVYMLTHTGNPDAVCGPQVPGAWNTADLRPFGVSEDAVAAFLSGILIITHGSTPGIADMHVVFRKPGDTSVTCSKYLGQVIETAQDGGQRSTMSTWIPLSGGKFEYCYQLYGPVTSDYPAGSAFGINLSLQAWAR